jgi:hypothetical protein
MPRYGPTVRLAILLHYLDTIDFKPLPPGVGRKTVNRAEEAGFIEVSDGYAMPKCRLTAAGNAHKQSNPYPFD